MGVEYCLLNLGQSNAEPKGVLSTYWSSIPDMNYSTLTPDPALGIYYGKAIESIRFLTFYTPEGTPEPTYPPAGPAPAPFTALGWEAVCQFLPWTALSGASNPNSANYRCPNAFCVPYDPLIALGSPGGYTNTVNSALDLARRMRDHIGKRINVITVAVDSSQLADTTIPIPLFAKRSWFDPRTHNTWSPTHDGTIWDRLVLTLQAAKLAAAAEGNTLEIVLVTMKQGESDVQRTSAADLFPTNAPTFVAKVRELIASLGLCSVPAWQIPWTWSKIPAIWGTAIPLLGLPGYPANLAKVNGTLQQLSDDDPYFRTYEVDSFITNDIHYNAAGIQLLAAADFDAWLAINSGSTASFPSQDVPTVQEMIDAVRRVTERNGKDSGQEDAVIIEAINEAYFDLLNFVGDTTWWLRITTPWTLTSDPRTAVELPRCVTRLLEIRPTVDPWASIDTSMVRHTDNGRVEIITLDVWSAEPVMLHHQYEPRKVSVATERLFLPRGYIEAVKVGAARRVCFNAGNMALQKELQGQEDRLKVQVSQHSNKVDRQRRQRLTGRRGTRYRRGLGDTWFNHSWRDG